MPTKTASTNTRIRTGIDVVIERRKRRLPQWKLAALIDVPAPHLSRVETNQRPLTPDMVAKIRAALATLDGASR